MPGERGWVGVYAAFLLCFGKKNFEKGCCYFLLRYVDTVLQVQPMILSINEGVTQRGLNKRTCSFDHVCPLELQ